MKKLSTLCIIAFASAALAAPTANEDFVIAEDAKTYTNAVAAAKLYTDAATNNIPRPDLSDYPTKAELTSGTIQVGFAQEAYHAGSADFAEAADSANGANYATSAITANTAQALVHSSGNLSADTIMSMIDTAAAAATNYTDVATASATNYTDSATNSLASSLVRTNALAVIPPFDFSTMAGMYRAISNIVHALGGSVTNFPAIPAQ